MYICSTSMSMIFFFTLYITRKAIKIIIKKTTIIKINLSSQTNINVFHKYFSTSNRYHSKFKEYTRLLIENKPKYKKNEKNVSFYRIIPRVTVWNSFQ